MRRRLLLALSVLPSAGRAQSRSPSRKPPPLLEKELAGPVPDKRAAVAGLAPSRGEAAPVPNRTFEGPVVAPATEGPTLEPSIIQRQLPGRGATSTGGPNRTEERLFDPAPGARLTVPFKY